MIVRTTMRPGVPIDIDEAEYTDLLRQGLLVKPEPVTPAVGTAAPAPSAAPVPPASPDHQESTACP